MYLDNVISVLQQHPNQKGRRTLIPETPMIISSLLYSSLSLHFNTAYYPISIANFPDGCCDLLTVWKKSELL